MRYLYFSLIIVLFFPFVGNTQNYPEKDVYNRITKTTDKRPFVQDNLKNQNFSVQNQVKLAEIQIPDDISKSNEFEIEYKNSHLNQNIGRLSVADKKWQAGGVFEGYTPEQEIVEKRTENSKKFRIGDDKVRVLIGGPFHYKDEFGLYQDISLDVVSSNDNKYSFLNESNSFKTYFGKDLKDGVKILKGQNNITIGVSPKIENNEDISIYESLSPEITNNENKVSYSGLFQDVNIDYEITETALYQKWIFNNQNIFKGIKGSNFIHVKENIIMPSGSAVFDELGKITDDRELKGTIYVVRGNDTLFSFLPSRMWDKKFDGDILNPSKDGKVVCDQSFISPVTKITGQNNGIIEITVILPIDWLVSPDRVYPVTLDPTVIISGAGTTGYAYPWETCWYQRMSQIIVLASDIGYTGTVTRIAFEQSANNALINTGSTIKYQTTTNAAFSDAVLLTTGWNQIFGASDLNYTATGSGWQWIDVNDFTYTGGSNNLMLETRFVNSSFSCSGGWYYWTATGNQHRYGYCDCSDYPATSSAYGTNTPLIQLDITTGSGPCASTTVMTCATTYSGTLATTGSDWSAYTGCAWSEPGDEAVYSFTPTVTGSYTFTTTTTTGDPDFFLMSACNNTSTNVYGSCWGSGNISVTLNAGTTYYLIVDNYSSISSAGYTVAVSCYTPCSSVINIGGCGSSYAQSYTGGGTGAWSSSYCGYSTPGIEQIYSFVAPSTGVYSLQVTAASGYVDYGWQASTCAETGWTCIDDIISTGTFGSMSWTAGTTYYILLDDENSTAGTHTFYINCGSCNDHSCSSATNIAALPYNASGLTTCGACNTYDQFDGCGSSFLDGPEYTFTYTPASTGWVNVVTTMDETWVNPTYGTNANGCSVFIFDACPDAGGDCIASSTVQYPSNHDSPKVKANLSAGHTYYIIVSGDPNLYNADACIDFAISVTSIVMPDPTGQDCFAAQPICSASWHEAASYSGTGAYPSEINSASSCLEGERNGSWYTFNVEANGTIQILIDADDNDDDFDFALYDVTSGGCAGIFNGTSPEVSCNYEMSDVTNGGTGSTGINTVTAATNISFENDVTVTAGNIYMLYISQWSVASGLGYTITLGGTADYIDSNGPALDAITSSPACGQNTITFNFTENVQCSSVASTDFTVTGPGGPYSITSVSSPICSAGGTYSQTYVLTLNTVLTAGGTYSLNLVSGVTDICSHTTTLNSLNFTVTGVTGTYLVNNNVSCYGGSNGSATATGSGGTPAYTYTWSTGTIGATANNLVAGNNYVTITDAVGVCSAVLTVNITQPAAITAYSVTGGGAYCSGGSGVTVGLSDSDVGVNYQLYIGGVPSGSPLAGTGGALSWNNQATAGTYTIVATNTTTLCTANMTGSATVTINPLPSAPTGVSASPTAICAGSSSTLSATVGSGGTAVYWYTGSCGGTYIGSGTSFIVTPGATTTYYARTYNSTTGCFSSTCVSVTVTVNALPSSPTGVSASPTAVCAGSSSSLSATAGSGGSTVYWYTGGCGSTFVGSGTTLAVSPAATTTYYAMTYNSTTGCYSSTCTSVTVTVNALPGVPTALLATPASICAGSSSTLTATVGSGGSTIYWYTGSCGGTMVGTGTSLVVTPASTTTYYARTYNSTTGCFSSSCATVSVTVNALPSAPSSISAIPSAVCAGSSSTLTATVGSGGSTIYWYTGSCGGTLVGTGTSLVVTPAATTTYYARTYNSTTGCFSSTCVSVTVTVNPLPNAPTGVSATPASICAGSSSTLSATVGSGGTDVYWYTGGCGTTYIGSGTSLVVTPAATTIYYARTYNSTTGCYSSSCSSVTVTVNALPGTPTALSATPNPICAGSSSTLNGTTGSGGSTIYWYTGSCGGTLAGTGTSLVVTPAVTTTYYARSYNSTTGCYSSACASITVTVNALPSAPSVISAIPSTICNGSNSTLSASVGSGGTTIYWYTGSCGGTLLGSGTSIVVSPAATTTYYAITYNSSTGCYSSTCQSATVTVNALPNAPTGISATPNPICAGASSTLSATTGSGGTTIHWYTGSCGGTYIGAGTSLVVTPAATTTYYARTYNATTGCYSSTCATITVTVNALPAVPTAVTASPAAICAGSSSTLSATVGAGGNQVNWYTGSCGGTLVGSGNQIVSPASTTTYYVLSVNTTTGCVSSSCGSVAVTVNANPVAYNVTGGGSYCAGGTGVAVGLSGSQNGITYALYLAGNPTGISITGTGGVISFGNQTSAGTYTVIATNASGCSSNMTGSAIITINPAPVVYNVTGGGAYCAGASGVAVGLSDSDAGITYALYLGGVPTGTTVAGTGSAISFGNQTTAGTYTVVATSGASCTSSMSGSAVIVVNPLPTAFNVTGGGSYCSGGTGVVVGLNGSTNGISYTLYYNGNPTATVVSGTGSAISFGNQTSAGTYTVVANNTTTGCTSTMTGSATVGIYSLPNVNAGVDQSIPNGTSTTINATVSGGGGGYIYSWTPSALLINATIVDPTTTNLSTTTTYTLLVTDANGCQNSDQVIITVTGGALAASASATPGTICVGASVQLNANPSGGSGSYSYSWSPSTGLSATNIVNPVATPTVTTTYTVTVGDGFNTVTSSVTITVNPLPIAYAVSGGGSYCAGGTGLSIILANSQVGVNYQLQLNGINQGGFVAGTSAGLSWTGQTSAGTYTIVATNASTGCTNNMTGSAVITVNPLPSLFNVTGGGAYCSGGTGVLVGLSGSQSGVNYTLYLGGTPTGNTVSGTGSSISFGNITAAGVYTVVATTVSTGCVNNMTGSVTVTINPLPTASALNTGPYCVGATIQLNAGGGASYSWSGPASFTSTAQNPTRVGATILMAGPYTVTVTSAFGCTSTATTTVVVNALPTPTASNGGAYCVGQTIALTSTGGTGYSWSGPNSFSSSLQNPTILSATTAMAGPYIVTVTNSATCTATATTNVVVNTNPTPVASNSGPYCAGATISLSSSGGTGYSWSGPNSFTSAIQNPTITGATSAMAGTYTVTVTNASGCTATISTSVMVNALPTPTASNGGAFCVGQTISLTSSGGTGYSWSGPNSFTSALQNPSITGATTAMAGTYTVTVTNASGCTATAATIVTVNNLPTPTASNGGAYCAGQTIALSSSGGTGYSWSGPNSFTSTLQDPTISGATSAMAGPYTVTVTNAAACTATATTNVVVNANPLPIASNTGPYCSGTTISLTSSGGTGYSWSGPNSYTSSMQNSTIASATTAMSGTYTVTVTNASSCTATASTIVTVNPLPTAYTVSGGGNYCSGGIGLPIGILNSQMNTTYELYLNGNPTGITQSGTGGPINFGNQTTAGTYTVVATNVSTLCTNLMTGSVIISINSLPLVNAGTDQTIPFGTSTSIDASVSGGGGGYTYSWTPTASLINATIVDPTTVNLNVTTTYTLSVTDINGCQNSDQVTIFITGSPLTASATSNPADICLGESAILNANAIGGSGTYTYIWSPATGLSATNISNPVATPTTTTTYYVTVNDGFNSATSSVSVIVYPLPTLYNVSGGGSYCADGTGLNIILSNSQGGVSYQLQLNGVNAGLPQNGVFAGLVWPNQMTAGVYTVIATNSTTGCLVQMNGSASITIDPLPTAFNVTGGGEFCSGGSGLAVGLSGSEIGITYQLILDGSNLGAPVSGSGSAIGFGNQTQAGTYTVLASNISTGCDNMMTGSVSIIVNPLPTVFNMTGGGNYCSGGVGLSIGLSGSETGLTYQLQINSVNQGVPVAGDGNPIDFGIFTQAGTYTVIATNTTTLCVNTMSGNSIISIDPLPVLFDMGGGGSYCLGGSGVNITLSGSEMGVDYQLYIDGFISGSATSGTGVALTWANQTASGIYTVIATNTVTSCVSNMNSSSSIVINPLPVIDSLVVEPLSSCIANDGELTVYASGGTLPYNYSIDGTNYYLTSAFTGLPAGTINALLVDANGCTTIANTIVPDSTGFAIDSVVITDILCFGDATGQIIIYADGAIQFSIDSGATYQTSNIFSNLPAANYNVVAIDAGGCYDYAMAKISEPDLITAVISSVGVSCNGLNDGNATISVYGGIMPYDYSWSDAAMTDSLYISGLLPDIYYYVAVTDSNGCVYNDSVMITEPDELTSSVVSTDVLCYNGSNGSAVVSVTGGTPAYTYLWSDILSTSSDTVSDLSANIWYYVTVTDLNNCFVLDSVMVLQPDSLELLVTVIDASCGGSDGSAFISASGGSSVYLYEWQDSTGTVVSTNDSISNLMAGNYTIVVTDGNGCVNSQTFWISNTSGGSLIVNSVENVSCYGAADGEIIVSVSGGTPDFTFEWSTGDSLVTTSFSDTLSGLDGGIYSVTVTDINGCFSDTTITLTEPSAIQVDTIVVGTSCYNTNDGLINVIVTGGNSPYIYTWDPAGYTQNGNMYSDLPFGSYSLTVTDNSGCFVSIAKIQVDRPSELSISINYSDPGCYGDTSGTVSVIPSGGTPPYSYIWNSTVMTSPEFVSDVTGLVAGTYFVTVTDDNLCATVDFVTLNEPVAMNMTIVDTVIAYIGQISTTVTGGIPPYIYIWSNGATTSGIAGLNTGDYIITVTDANGCQLSDTVEIKIPLIIPTMFTPNGDGYNDNWDITNIGEYENLTIEIYNRWGDVVFSFSNKSGMEYMSAPWDGTYNGTELPMSSFVYIIDLLDGSEPYTGVVAIKR